MGWTDAADAIIAASGDRAKIIASGIEPEMD